MAALGISVRNAGFGYGGALKSSPGSYTNSVFGTGQVTYMDFSGGGGSGGPAPTPTIKVWDWDTSTWVLQPAT